MSDEDRGAKRANLSVVFENRGLVGKWPTRRLLHFTHRVQKYSPESDILTDEKPWEPAILLYPGQNIVIYPTTRNRFNKVGIKSRARAKNFSCYSSQDFSNC